MITTQNLEELLVTIGYKKRNSIYEKKYSEFDCSIFVDFEKKEIIYPEDKGLKITRKTTCNFSEPENFVVLECITRLMDKGYRPEHIELEKEWPLGHERKSGFADILVKNIDNKTLFIIECKTFGPEYKKELNNMNQDGGQLFSYWQQEKNCSWLILYSSTINEGKIEYVTTSICCLDDNNMIANYERDNSIKLYRNAKTTEELFSVWDETYDKLPSGDVVFRDDSVAYQIGRKPLRKKDLKDFSENDKIVNTFEEILRHNNVSDKENAFNRLIALFICKLVDEIQKQNDDIVEFQYKVGTDTYESLQDRLQKLHKEGMEKFMKEDIFYVSDDYAEKLVQQYTHQNRKNMIAELKKTLRILKFYTNNDFAFKDVHNEELFFQNGKVVKEVVQLFENYRIIGSSNLQMLGDMFEQLLNKGFKQNEGQFFTPLPIGRFMWESLPLKEYVRECSDNEIPKILDFACGAGHFLTEAYDVINDTSQELFDECLEKNWPEKKLFGIEKDYRLARVSKISLFMHGAGAGNIIFGDGLENYSNKGIIPNTFDIVIANPPYSVEAFKQHLKLKENKLEILDKISNTGKEIETLFVERLAQLIKPKGLAAIILPSSILNKDNESFVAARESILKNFNVKAIVQMGGKTFGATQTTTVILFLSKFSEPPKRCDQVLDSVDAIFNPNAENKEFWEDNDILIGYLNKIGVDSDQYIEFIKETKHYKDWNTNLYFSQYIKFFEKQQTVKQKKNTKTFKKLPIEQQNTELDTLFYEYVKSIERNKIEYFAYVYNQLTLIVKAPKANKEQVKFLGYSWSNRKGQEGIQLERNGGLLYDINERFGSGSISSLIRNNFLGSVKGEENLSKYYNYKPLHELIDFNNVEFKKVIKTTGYRIKKPKKDYDIVYLSNDNKFKLVLGNRVVADEQLIENGKIPVYSANVFKPFGYINDEILEDYSKDSIIWGIDGDWMVNIIPKDTKFYPTDHCGVMTIKEEDILPKYMKYALEAEGEIEGFSRSNRASIQRIAALSIYVPNKQTQKQIIQKIEKVDTKIAEENKKLENVENEIIKKFDKNFSNYNPSVKLEDYYSVEKGTSITEKKTKPGNVPVVGGGVSFSYYHNLSNREAGIVTVSASGANAGYVNYWNIPIFASDCNTINTKDKNKFVNEFVYVYLKKNQQTIFEMQKGMGQPHVYDYDINPIEIPKPPITKQNEFAEFVKEKEIEVYKAQQSLLKLKESKKELMEKYFK